MYLYCQNPRCGVYLGAHGGDKCVLCGWNAGRCSGDEEQYPPCDYCAEPLSYHPWHGSGLINGVESRHIHACDKCRHLLPAVSAGGADECAEFQAAADAAFRDWEKDGNRIPQPNAYMTARDGFRAGAEWQARAALSANHSEQVREGFLSQALTHYEAALQAAFPSGSSGAVFSQWNQARRMLAAAPSAVSQKEQGE